MVFRDAAGDLALLVDTSHPMIHPEFERGLEWAKKALQSNGSFCLQVSISLFIYTAMSSRSILSMHESLEFGVGTLMQIVPLIFQKHGSEFTRTHNFNHKIHFSREGARPLVLPRPVPIWTPLLAVN